MASNIKEMRLASMLAWGAMAVTLIITDRVSTEPANLGKMLLLSALGLGVLPLFYSNFRNLFEANKQIVVFGVLFILVSFASILASSNPFERGFYGAFGRNTGFLSYFMLFIVLLAATELRNTQSFKKILKALFIAGFLNIVYCLFASTGYDVFNWQNPTTAVLGTFGNPNFIGAFMGIFAGFVSVQIVNHFKNKKYVLTLSTILGLTIYVIYLSDALQGLLVAVFGITATLYFLIRSMERISRLSSVFLGTAASFGVVGLLGILNIGPLARFLYKTSITFRGEYWFAGLNMGTNNPFLGVGMDSYGVFYRTYRDESAVLLPGVDVTTDAAHNVVIDIFSGTGVLGVLCYIAIVMIVLKTALSYIRKRKEFDPVFLSLFIPWLGYQLQSLISINQLGLAIWGWLLSGAVIGYVHSRSAMDMLKNLESPITKRSKKVSDLEQLLPAGTVLAVFGSVVIGALIALPPFLADARSRNLMIGNSDSTAVINLAKEFPVDTIRINRSIVGLANSGLNLLAVDLAKYGTEKFPNDYASWYSLYELSGPGTPDSEVYRKKLHEIDPFNPKYFDK
jgi:O-antigen ligase